MPGVRYRVEADDEVQFVDLVEDGSDRLTLLVSSAAAAHATLQVEVRTPQRPTSVHLTATGSTGDQWLTGGAWSADATIERDQFPGGRRAGRPIVGRAVHRLVAGRGVVTVHPRDNDRWDVTVDLQVTGRGCLRPLGFVAGALARRTVERELAATMDHLPDAVADLNRELAALREEGPEAVAARILRSLLVPSD